MESKEPRLQVKIGDIVQSYLEEDTQFIVLEVYPEDKNKTIVIKDGIIDKNSADDGWFSLRSKIVGHMDVRVLRILYGV